jgi:hypothetical protein
VLATRPRDGVKRPDEGIALAACHAVAGAHRDDSRWAIRPRLEGSEAINHRRILKLVCCSRNGTSLGCDEVPYLESILTLELIGRTVTFVRDKEPLRAAIVASWRGTTMHVRWTPVRDEED